MEILIHQLILVIFFSNNSSRLTIGVAPYGRWSWPYMGLIDDIRLYNRTLTDAEIQNLYKTTSMQINYSPLAVFSTSVVQNDTGVSKINLNAIDSSDIDGNINLYEWKSSDGQTTYGKTASLNFSNSGEYNITLTITDDQGATSQAENKIQVNTSSISNTILSCANTVINDCRASYINGIICIPCLVIPNMLGTSQIFSLEMSKTNPLNLNFKVDPLSFKQHDFRDSCAANYNSINGLLTLPCISVDENNYTMDMQQQSDSLIFNVIDIH